MVAPAKALEEEERRKARERERVGRVISYGNFPRVEQKLWGPCRCRGRPCLKPKRNAGAVFSEKKAILRAISDNRKLLKGEKGKTRDLLAKRVGVSGQTLEKAMAVVESGDQKLIKMMDEAARDAALYDAQILAIALLWAEARLGELLKTNPPGFQRGKSGQIKQNPLPPGITHKQSFYAQRLAEILKNRLGGALP